MSRTKQPIDKFRGDHGFLSNFHPAKVWLGGIAYPTVEHAYQAAKTVDRRQRRRIRRADTPAHAKKLGRQVTLRSDWDDETKIGIMGFLLRQKFAHAHLRRRLLDTDDRELIEGNDWGDRFWGVSKGKGRNELGKLLMVIREEIIQYERNTRR